MRILDGDYFGLLICKELASLGVFDSELFDRPRRRV